VREIQFDGPSKGGPSVQTRASLNQVVFRGQGERALLARTPNLLDLAFGR